MNSECYADWKMTAFSGIADVLSTLRGYVIEEKNKLINGAEGVISSVAGKTRDSYEDIINFILSHLDKAGHLIELDVQKVETMLLRAKDNIEAFAEKEYHSFISRIESAITEIRTVSSAAIGDVREASDYIRHKAYTDLQHAVSDAKGEFILAKDDFKSAITSMADDVIEKVKNAISDVGSGAEKGVSKFASVRSEIEDKIEEKVREVKSKLEKAKATATKDLDRIATLIKTELDNLEEKFKSFEKRADSLGKSIIMGALSAAILIGGSIIMLKILSAEHNKKQAALLENTSQETSTPNNQRPPNPNPHGHLAAQYQAQENTSSQAPHQQQNPFHTNTTTHQGQSVPHNTTTIHQTQSVPNTQQGINTVLHNSTISGQSPKTAPHSSHH